jgi:hypothetical protein
MYGKIYKIHSKLSKEVYVGSTKGTLGNRFKSHKQNAKGSRATQMHKYFNRSGWKNVQISLLENCKGANKNDLMQCEAKWVKRLGTLNTVLPGRGTKFIDYSVANFGSGRIV